MFVLAHSLESPPTEYAAFIALLDRYDLDPVSPLVFLALSAVSNDQARKAKYENLGITGAESEEGGFRFYNNEGTEHALAAAFLWLHGDKGISRKTYVRLISESDQMKETWGSEPWLQRLEHQEDIDDTILHFRDALIELASALN